MIASSISPSRCLRHPQREAVARCPECRNFYCRECVTEHDDRVICQDCLARLTRPPELARKTGLLTRLGWLGPIGQSLCTLLLAWFIFYLSGRLLVRIPSSFHEGTLWQKSEAGATQE